MINGPISTPNESLRPEMVEILLVDDREENLLALEAVLANPDYRLVRAYSGDAALRYLLEHDPALILMDVQMPQLDGFATAAIIKGSPRTRDIPIIFLTAIGKEERFVHKGYEHGAVDYMTKPFDARILQSKVAVFADLYRKNENLIRAERRIREIEKKDRERRIAELELKGLRREQIEQKKYRDLVDGIENGIVWAANPVSMQFSFISQPAERLLGYPAQNWIVSGKFWEQCLPAEDLPALRAAIEKANTEEGRAEFEHRLLTRDGRSLWFRTSIRLENASEESPPELRGLSVEITDSKEASRLLELSKVRSDILAQVGLILAESFDYAQTLPKLADYLASNYADWVQLEIRRENGKRDTLTFAHSDPSVSKRARACVEEWDNGEPLAPPEHGLRENLDDFSLRALALSAEHFRFLGTIGLRSSLSFALEARGQTFGRLIIGRTEDRPPFRRADFELGQDLSFRIGAAVDNWRLYQDAQAAIRIRDEFLSIASHELKTPLTPLKIQTQQLLRLLSKEQIQNIDVTRVERMLHTSNRQIERLSKLIDDLLDISRINTGKLQLNLEEFDLMEVLADIKQRFVSQLTASNCELSIRGPGRLPVSLDIFRLEQVVVNLLTNAMKYGPGKPIEILVEPRGERFSISVRDGGIGIAPADQERIFLRFERAVSSTHFGGLGLGLYIVTQILEAHGGNITVDSEIERGSLFRVDLPMRAPALIPASLGQELAPTAAASAV